MDDQVSRESLVALKIYYHDVTLAFVKDSTLHTLKYTELTQSLSSFLNYLLTVYKNDCQNTNRKYIPLREAMKIYSTRYCFKIHSFRKYLILRKVFKEQDIVSDNIIYDEDSIKDDNHVWVINYRNILNQTANVSENFIRNKLKINYNINKQKMIEDLKKSLSVPVKSDKAMNMMYNMGWDGGSLGVRGDGIIEPIMPAIDLNARAGLGHVNEKDADRDPLKQKFIVNILKDFLEFLKTDDLCLELICPRRISKKDQGFITNLINMVNIRRRVEVKDEERNVLLNQIYEISCLKSFSITGLIDGKSRIKFTKTPSVRPFGTYDGKLSQSSMAPNVRHVSITPASPTIDLGQGSVRYANTSLLNIINSRYVTPFSPLDISRQNLNLSIFKTTALLFVLDFNGSNLDRLEVFFEKILNTKERGYIIEIVDAINKGHNKNGCKTKIDTHLVNQILAMERTYYLVAGFGKCNTSFTLEKVYDRHKASPKRLKLNSRRNETNTKNCNMNDIFASLDKAFPPLMWSETNLARLEVDKCKRHDENRKNVSYANKQSFVKIGENVTEDASSDNMTSNLIIVKNVRKSDQEIDSVRKIYINKNYNGSSPYVRNTSQSWENLKSDSENNFTNGFIKSSLGNSRPFTATNDSANVNIEEKDRQCKLIGKSEIEKLDNNKNDDSKSDDISDIEISVGSYDDSDIEMLSEELSPEEDIKTPSRMNSPVHSETGEFDEIAEKHTEIAKIRDDNTTARVIEERVQRMNIKENGEDLCKKKRVRTDSENSDVTIFKKYKTVDRITYVNLTPKDPTENIDEVEFVKKVQTVISLMLDITNELPLLKCHGYRNGALVYSCHNEKSLSWLQTHCVTTDDIKMTITEEVLVESVKMSLKINCYIDENYKKIFHRLESYNEGLSTSHWVWLKEEKFNGYMIITFKIDEITFNYIQSKNFRLFLGIDEAQFSVVWN